MEITNPEAMSAVYGWEGPYSDDADDDGGPTKWGITIDDARHWWKPDATAADVRAMPQSVAADIYAKRYAAPLRYSDLPAGVDLAVLDYGINSGIHRSATVLQGIVGAHVDGIIGPLTIAACAKLDPAKVVNAIYDERLAFLKRARNKKGTILWPIFGGGWSTRCKEGRALALSFVTKYPAQPEGTIVSTPTIPSPPLVPTLGAIEGQIAEVIEARIIAACTARNPVLGAIVAAVLGAGIRVIEASPAPVSTSGGLVPATIIHELSSVIGAAVSGALAKATTAQKAN